MKRSVVLYVTAVVGLNIVSAIAVAFLHPAPTPDDWTTSVFFALMGVIALLLGYQRNGATTDGSVSFLPFLSGVLVAPTDGGRTGHGLARITVSLRSA
jgi:hypothetical protein